LRTAIAFLGALHNFVQDYWTISILSCRDIKVKKKEDDVHSGNLAAKTGGLVTE
jgi:hypothetical protein